MFMWFFSTSGQETLTEALFSSVRIYRSEEVLKMSAMMYVQITSHCSVAWHNLATSIVHGWKARE